MSALRRTVCPEMLDELDPEDPRAQRARRDLQRVHRVMASVAILRKAVARLRQAPPRTIVELGAGDGTLLLRFARARSPGWRGVELTLLDRQPAVAARTVEDYRRLDWRVDIVRMDALAWAEEAAARADLVITTLFLHHFANPALRLLLAGIAARARAFIAIEPRRDRFAFLGSHLIGLLGTNAVTRADAVTSVTAGFAGAELSAAWNGGGESWRIEEYRAFPFSHCFVAARNDAAAGPA